MDRVLETHQFGSHHVAVIEHVEDDGISYSVFVDDRPVTDEPLGVPPRFEDVVRLYTRFVQPHTSASGGPDAPSDWAGPPTRTKHAPARSR